MAGIDVSLPVINWCINLIVLRVEWWLDGKQFSSLNHMKSNCASYSSCLQRVSRAKRLVSDSCCSRRCLTQLAGDRDKLFSVPKVSQSVNASFKWDLTIQSVHFWIVFLTEDTVFDILSVLADTHRTRSVTALLPISRTRSSDFL